VLVVEDSFAIRDLIMVNLQLEGFEVTTALDDRHRHQPGAGQ